MRATFFLATCYDFGLGRNRDRRTAVQLYRKAARSGHETAQYNLAMCLRDGDGARKNLRAAFAWFKEAAKNGSEDAGWT